MQILIIAWIAISICQIQVRAGSLDTALIKSLTLEIGTSSTECINKVSQIPRSVKKEYRRNHYESFRMANPKRKYRETDLIGIHNLLLPCKRLNFAIQTENYLIIHYNHGGRGHHSHVSIYNISDKKKPELIANCYSKELNSLAELVSYMNSGKLRKIDSAALEYGA